VLVTLTAAGRAAVDAALDELLEQERSLLSSLDPDDAETLAASLRTLARHV
jgi:DNA-binding MarR family transcriptional regulator